MAPDSHVTDTGYSKLGAMERLRFLAEIVVPLCAAVLGVMQYAMGPHVPWYVYAVIAAAVALVVSGVRRVLRKRRNARLVELLIGELRTALRNFARKQPAGYLSNDRITMADLISDTTDSLYVDPEFETTDQRPGSSAVDLICRSLQERRSVAILGDPGQGKSLVLLKAYSRLLHRFAANPSYAFLPLLIRMHSLPRMPAEDEAASVTGSRAGRLSRTLCGALSLPVDVLPLLERLVAESRVVLLLDGADEMRLEAARSAHFDDVGPYFDLLFTLPVALSSRTEFYDVNVAPSKIGEHFSRELRLKDWDFPRSGERLLKGIRAKSGSDDGQLISSAITASPPLMDLARKPLTLFMIADCLPLQLADPATPASHGTGWGLSDLYEEYSNRWLQVESRKGGRVPPETKRQLMQTAAWRIFTQSGLHGAQMGRYQLQDLLLRDVDLDDIARTFAAPEPSAQAYLHEMQSRSFLVPADIPAHHRFVHKSFFEYFTARHIASRLGTEETRLTELKSLLSPVIPDEINSFLRSLLQRNCRHEPKRRITEAKLLETFAACSAESDDHHTMIRQQAMNLLPIIWPRTNTARLLTLLAADPSPLVRRGGAVRLALEDISLTPLESFVHEMRDPNSPEWKVHLGYNRIYYGDQLNRVDGWLDDGTPDCDGFFLASLSQLHRDSHRVIWPMALTTIRLLLDDPHRSPLTLLRTNPQTAAALSALTDHARPEAGPVYEAERRELAAFLRTVGL